jgi:hypothetical protein
MLWIRKTPHGWVSLRTWASESDRVRQAYILPAFRIPFEGPDAVRTRHRDQILRSWVMRAVRSSRVERSQPSPGSGLKCGPAVPAMRLPALGVKAPRSMAHVRPTPYAVSLPSSVRIRQITFSIVESSPTTKTRTCHESSDGTSIAETLHRFAVFLFSVVGFGNAETELVRLVRDSTPENIDSRPFGGSGAAKDHYRLGQCDEGVG